jgi:hypothetical protein
MTPTRHGSLGGVMGGSVSPPSLLYGQAKKPWTTKVSLPTLWLPRGISTQALWFYHNVYFLFYTQHGYKKISLALWMIAKAYTSYLYEASNSSLWQMAWWLEATINIIPVTTHRSLPFFSFPFSFSFCYGKKHLTRYTFLTNFQMFNILVLTTGTMLHSTSLEFIHATWLKFTLTN